MPEIQCALIGGIIYCQCGKPSAHYSTMGMLGAREVKQGPPPGGAEMQFTVDPQKLQAFTSDTADKLKTLNPMERLEFIAGVFIVTCRLAGLHGTSIAKQWFYLGPRVIDMDVAIAKEQIEASFAWLETMLGEAANEKPI